MSIEVENTKTAENNEARYASDITSPAVQTKMLEEQVGLNKQMVGSVHMPTANEQFIAQYDQEVKRVPANDAVDAVGGAVLDIPQDLANTAMSLHDAYAKYGLGVDSNLEQYRMTFSEDLFPRSKDWGYNLVRDIGSAAMSFGALGGVTKGVKATTTAAKFAKTMALSSVVDFTQADPSSENLFNLARKYPALAGVISESLENDQTDLEITNRMRNALEGFIIGAPLELAVSGVTSLVVKAKANNALKGRELPAEQPPLSQADAPTSVDYTTQDIEPEAIDIMEGVTEQEAKNVEAIIPKAAEGDVPPVLTKEEMRFEQYLKDIGNSKKNVKDKVQGMTINKDIQEAKKGAELKAGRGMVSVGKNFEEEFKSARKYKDIDFQQFIEDAKKIAKEEVFALDPKLPLSTEHLTAAENLYTILHLDSVQKASKYLAEKTPENREVAMKAFSEAAIMQTIASGGGTKAGFDMRSIQEIQRSFGISSTKPSKAFAKARDGFTKSNEIDEVMEALVKEAGIDIDTMFKNLTDDEVENIAKRIEAEADAAAEGVLSRGKNKTTKKIADNIRRQGVAGANKVRKERRMPVEDYNEKLIKLKPTPKTQEILRKSLTGQIGAFLVSTRIGGLLFAPATHVQNVFGNGYAVVSEIATRSFGRAFSIARGSDGIRDGEVTAQIAGILDTAGESLRIWKRHFLTGEKKYMSHKVDLRTTFTNPESHPITKGMNYLWNMSLRTLGATDDMFKHINFGMEQNRKLTLAAMDNAIPRDKSTDFFKAMKTELDESMNETYKSDFGIGYEEMKMLKEDIEQSAMNFADIQTYTNKLGGALGSFSSAVHQSPILGSMIPFLTANTNSFIMGVKDTPLHAVYSVVKNASAFKDMSQAAKADMLAGKLAYSSLMASLIWQFESTGSEPRNKEAKDIWQAQGKKPNMVKIGDTWVSTTKLGPLAVPFNMVADMKQLYNEVQGHPNSVQMIEGLTGGIIATLSGVFTPEFLNVSLAEVLDLAAEGKQTSQIIQSKLATVASQYVTPFNSAFRAFNNANDKTIRLYKGDEKGLQSNWEEFKAHVLRPYGFDDTGMPLRNILGEPLQMSDNFPSNLLPLFATDKVDTSKTAQEINSLFSANEIMPLANEDTRVTGFLNKISPVINEPAAPFNVSVRLTNSQYNKLQMIATGNVPDTEEYAPVKFAFKNLYAGFLNKRAEDKQYTIREIIEELVTTEKYVTADTELKKIYIIKAINTAQSIAVELMRTDPDVRNALNVKYEVLKRIQEAQ